MKERIQKVLSAQGYCSRRAAEELIRQGKVFLNGRRAILGDTMEVGRDVIHVEGSRVRMEKRPEKYYYILNKPRGVVTTMGDEHAKKTVVELMEDIGVRLFPVGRLDKDSEGLLIMTNDGALANNLTHPSKGIAKVYRVSVSPKASERQITELAGGVQLEDGFARPASLRVTSDDSDKTVMEMVMREGRNREIRRMCEAVGLTVTRLKRTSYGPVKLGNLPAGQYRELTKQEISALRAVGTARK